MEILTIKLNGNMITAIEARQRTVSSSAQDLMKFLLEMQQLEQDVMSAADKGKTSIQSTMSEWSVKKMRELGYNVELLGGGRGIYLISWS